MTNPIYLDIREETDQVGLNGAGLFHATSPMNVLGKPNFPVCLAERSRQPFLDAARKLLELGYDPQTILIMRHSKTGTESLRGPIGEAAKLTVIERPNGPKFELYESAASIRSRMPPKSPAKPTR